MPLSTDQTIGAIDLQNRLISCLRTCDTLQEAANIGLAVSGGGDSMALMQAAAKAFAGSRHRLFVTTVDHGLRGEAADEAAFVGRSAAALGLPHDTLVWEDTSGPGNLQDRARRARYTLLTDWAKAKDISCLVLGHTADDQAETVLMRLRREAGADGLSGMGETRMEQGVMLVRPFLTLRRSELRRFLEDLDVDWVDDPSNEDLTFERIRMRRATEQLAELGVSVENLAQVAENMSRVRSALQWSTARAAHECVSVRAGAVVFEQNSYQRLPDEIANRLLKGALKWLTRQPYAPRRGAMDRAVATARTHGTTTLCGCQLQVSKGRVWIFREFNAVNSLICRLNEPWDGRWELSGPAETGQIIKALGPQGLQYCENWRDLGCPAAVLHSVAAVWKGDEMMACPSAGLDNGWAASLSPSEDELYQSFLSH